jgi:hypothetical protein
MCQLYCSKLEYATLYIKHFIKYIAPQLTYSIRKRNIHIQVYYMHSAASVEEELWPLGEVRVNRMCLRKISMAMS